jgi:hypothetical protein
VDALPDAPLAEKDAWAVEGPGEHALVVTCAAAAAACRGAAACEAERKVDARIEVTVE